MKGCAAFCKPYIIRQQCVHRIAVAAVSACTDRPAGCDASPLLPTLTCYSRSGTLRAPTTGWWPPYTTASAPCSTTRRRLRSMT